MPVAGRGIVWSAIVAAAAFTGCCPPQLRPPPTTSYSGPTESVDAVVQHVNANAGRVPSVWTNLSYSASIVDPQRKRTTEASGDGTLLYRRPGQLLLACNKDVAGQVLQLGTDGTEFWCQVRASATASDYWWGRSANVGKPCCRPVPVRPDLIVEVLGVGLLQTNLLQQPVPVMRFDNEHDAYVFDFIVRRADRWVTLKEVAYDRATCLPKRVALYDDAGRMVLRAELYGHAPVGEQTPGQADDRPRVARQYDLWFPDTGSTMTLRLDDPALTHKAGRLTFPNDNSFRRPEPDDPGRATHVDAECGGGDTNG